VKIAATNVIGYPVVNVIPTPLSEQVSICLSKDVKPVGVNGPGVTASQVGVVLQVGGVTVVFLRLSASLNTITRICLVCCLLDTGRRSS
jgi:hypothetical protein